MRNKVSPEAPEQSYLQRYTKEPLGKSAVMLGASFSKALTGSGPSSSRSSFQNAGKSALKEANAGKGKGFQKEQVRKRNGEGFRQKGSAIK